MVVFREIKMQIINYGYKIIAESLNISEKHALVCASKSLKLVLKTVDVVQMISVVGCFRSNEHVMVF